MAASIPIRKCQPSRSTSTIIWSPGVDNIVVSSLFFDHSNQYNSKAVDNNLDPLTTIKWCDEPTINPITPHLPKLQRMLYISSEKSILNLSKLCVSYKLLEMSVEPIRVSTMCRSLYFLKRPTSNEKEPRRTKKLIEKLFNGVYQYNRRKYSKIVNKSRRVENANEILSLI